MPCAEGQKSWWYAGNCNGNEKPCILCGQMVCSYHACANSGGVKGGHGDCKGKCHTAFPHMCGGVMKRCLACELPYCDYHSQQTGRGRVAGGHECTTYCKVSKIYRQNCSGEIRKCKSCDYKYCDYHFRPVAHLGDIVTGHVCTGITSGAAMGNALSEIWGGTITDRVDSVFEGRVRGNPGDPCIVSFPGKYLAEWGKLVEGRTCSACVFLPKDDPKKRFGRHSVNPETDRCFCHDLYGEEKEWGCRWFESWNVNLQDAVRLKLRLIVVFFEGMTDRGIVRWEDLPHQGVNLWKKPGGLGGSQKGEVAWILKHGFDYRSMDIRECRRLLEA
mmetsp:Transcript_5800/g.17136  ORF Transcript_5800/g.17136 Transcript_5800/m.17136 type:complete len:331 (+) Transcript_5800:45-1037(+)